MAISDKEDGQDGNEQREAAVRILSDLGQRRRTGELGEGDSWDKVSIGTQMLGAIRQAADTFVGKRLQRIDRAGLSGYETWLESRITTVYERTMCARLLAMFPLHAILFVVVGHKKWLRCASVLFFFLLLTVQTALMSCTSVDIWTMSQIPESRERVEFCIRRD